MCTQKIIMINKSEPPPGALGNLQGPHSNISSSYAPLNSEPVFTQVSIPANPTSEAADLIQRSGATVISLADPLS